MSKTLTVFALVADTYEYDDESWSIEGEETQSLYHSREEAEAAVRTMTIDLMRNVYQVNMAINLAMSDGYGDEEPGMPREQYEALAAIVGEENLPLYDWPGLSEGRVFIDQLNYDYDTASFTEEQALEVARVLDYTPAVIREMEVK